MRSLWPICDGCTVPECVHRDSDTSCQPLHLFGLRDPARTLLGSERATEVMRRCNSLAMPDASDAVPMPKLPGFIPQAQPDSITSSFLRPYMALALDRFASPRRVSFVAGQRTARRWKAEGAEAVILVATGDDPLIEAVYREHDRWTEAVCGSSVDCSTALAFSVYLTREPFENRFQHWRTVDSFNRLARTGTPAILPAGFTDPKEAAWLGAWFNSHRVKAALFDLQQPGKRGDDVLRDSLPLFLEEASSLETVIVNGLGIPHRMLAVRELIRKHSRAQVTVVSRSPHYLASFGLEWHLDQRGRLYDGYANRSVPKHALYRNMVEHCEALNRGTDTQYRPLGQSFSIVTPAVDILNSLAQSVVNASVRKPPADLLSRPA